ncbi:hypothetical protein K491DRAFT_696252 [Lophiostoma macrostomum CBS 122681]|uniref:Uncharacterized protein n=1 Tax=Lophiostoma macrostomum CBS 122681 TaxID=1314788 RepID=A0A6A6SZG3_9PLEO|nr:hypothetical protein K491DRAFT_696252 [Lophiostoma macrostomum CBS 122681]
MVSAAPSVDFKEDEGVVENVAVQLLVEVDRVLVEVRCRSHTRRRRRRFRGVTVSIACFLVHSLSISVRYNTSPREGHLVYRKAVVAV